MVRKEVQSTDQRLVVTWIVHFIKSTQELYPALLAVRQQRHGKHSQTQPMRVGHLHIFMADRSRELNFLHTKLPSMWSIRRILTSLLRTKDRGPQNIFHGPCTMDLTSRSLLLRAWSLNLGLGVRMLVAWSLWLGPQLDACSLSLGAWTLVLESCGIFHV